MRANSLQYNLMGTGTSTVKERIRRRERPVRTRLFITLAGVSRLILRILSCTNRNLSMGLDEKSCAECISGEQDTKKE